MQKSSSFPGAEPLPSLESLNIDSSNLTSHDAAIMIARGRSPGPKSDVSPGVGRSRSRSQTPSLAQVGGAMLTLKKAMRNRTNFLSAKQEMEIAKQSNPSSEQEASPSYRLAFADADFLTSESLRPMRLALEYQKTEEILKKHGVENCIVVFGSARIRERKELEKQITEAESLLVKNPDNEQARMQLRKAQGLLPLSKYYDEIRKFGQIVGAHHEKDNLVIMTGGGPGIMEAACRGAYDKGAPAVGINILLPFEQHPNPYVSPHLCVLNHYFSVRKMHLLNRAKALIVGPGGFGSLDELFECITLIQTKKMARIPVVLMGIEFWTKVVNWKAFAEYQLILEKDLELVDMVETAEEAWKIVDDFYKSGWNKN